MCTYGNRGAIVQGVARLPACRRVVQEGCGGGYWIHSYANMLVHSWVRNHTACVQARGPRRLWRRPTSTPRSTWCARWVLGDWGFGLCGLCRTVFLQLRYIEWWRNGICTRQTRRATVVTCSGGSRSPGPLCPYPYPSPAQGDNKSIPAASSWKLSPDAKYVHYCDNETIGGVEFKSTPDVGDK